MRSNVTCFNSSIHTTLNSPLAIGAFDPNLSAPANISSPVDNVRDVIKSRDNIGYAIGNILYMIWQNLPTLSLPTASAENIKQISTSKDNVIQAVNHDVEVSLRSTQRKFEFDEKYQYDQKINQQRLSRFMVNIENSLRIAANRGPKTAELIDFCVRNTQIILLDRQYAKELIRHYNKHIGGPFRGFYFTIKDTGGRGKLLLLNIFDGLDAAGLIIHECGHAKESIIGITYNPELLDLCVDNIYKISSLALKYFDTKNKGAKRKIEKLAREYQGEKLTATYYDYVNTVQKAAGYDKESDTFSSEIGNTKIIVGITKDRGKKPMMAEELRYVFDKHTDEYREATQTEKDVYTFIKMIFRLKTTRENTISNLPPLESIVETHAALKQYFPEKTLDKLCPLGFGEEQDSSYASKRIAERNEYRGMEL